MNLINKDHSINPHLEFEIPKQPGKRLRIIGTRAVEYFSHSNRETTQRKWWQLRTIDEVKNLDTGKITEVTRAKLWELGPIITIEQPIVQNIGRKKKRR